MKFVCIFPFLLVATLAIEKPDSFLRGFYDDRDLILFTPKTCQRELKACQADLSKSEEGWEAVLAASGSDDLQVIADATTDYSTMMASFSKLTVRERMQNAVKTIPQITVPVSALTRTRESDDQKKILTIILNIGDAIADFVRFIVGIDLSIFITIGTISVDLITAFVNGNAVEIITTIISSFAEFLSLFARNLRTVNLFASADNECMAELMTCNEHAFLTKVVPLLIALENEEIKI